MGELYQPNLLEFGDLKMGENRQHGFTDWGLVLLTLEIMRPLTLHSQ